MAFLVNKSFTFFWLRILAGSWMDVDATDFARKYSILRICSRPIAAIFLFATRAVSLPLDMSLASRISICRAGLCVPIFAIFFQEE
jgi:hypothetical protein